MKDKLIKRKVKELVPKYDGDKYIIGDIVKNSYVQFVPTLKGYHLNKQKHVCTFQIEDLDLRKKIICPTCGLDLMPELKGEGK